MLADAGDLRRPARALQRQQLERWRHPGGLGLPVEDQRGRRHHQRRVVQPAGLLLDQQMGQRLGGFAQAHVVGQDAGQAVRPQVLQPGQADLLVGPQRDTQAGRRLDRRRRGAGTQGVQPLQAGVALQGPVLQRPALQRPVTKIAAGAGVAGHRVLQAGAQQRQALRLPR